MERIAGRSTQILAILVTTVGLLIGLGGVGVAEQLDRDETEVHTTAPEVEQVGEGALPEIEIDADDITMEATMDRNGSATLRVIYTIRLDTDADTEAFEELRAEIESEPSSYLDPFAERMNRTVDTAEAATGREMSARGFEISTTRDSQLQTELGRVIFEFDWPQFAAVGDDGTIRAGDAVDSLFLGEGESLEFRWPEGYAIESSNPAPERAEARLAVWRGPIEFDAGQPRLVLTSGGTVTETPGGSNGEPTDTDDGSGSATDTQVDGSGENGEQPDDSDGNGPGFATVPVVGAVGLLLIASAAVALFVRKESDGGQQAPADPSETTPPDELLSNEERVLQLLTQNGGRMKQKQVAEQLDWTAAKTSQVVGDLRDDDEVESFRLGRENVLTLPDVDIEGGNDDDEAAEDSTDDGKGSPGG